MCGACAALRHHGNPGRCQNSSPALSIFPFSLLPPFYPNSGQQNLTKSPIGVQPVLSLAPLCPVVGGYFCPPRFAGTVLSPEPRMAFFFFLGRGGGEGTQQGRAPTAPPRTPTKRRRCPGAWKDLEGSGGSGREPCGKDFPRGKGTFEAPVMQPWEPGVSGRVVEGRPETVASC